jgi:thiol-disulfide isomerase/thioredoxin
MKHERFRLTLGLALLAAGCYLASALPAASFPPGDDKDKKKIEVKVVKHADLVKAIAANKGKVVLVDFWATWCAPCVKKFPDIVAMHEKYHDKGLVVIAVTFDKPTKIDNAVKFLEDKKAYFTNFLIEDPNDCQDHWDFAGIPTYLVYGKDGKLSKKFTNDPDLPYTIEDIQKTVEKELK